MTYSYGRALQQSALKFWSKDTKNIKETQIIFNHRAKMCSLASKGEWTEKILADWESFVTIETSGAKTELNTIKTKYTGN